MRGGHLNVGYRDPALFNQHSVRLDATRIAGDLQLPISTIAAAIGKKAPSVRRHPDATSLQLELRQLYRIWVPIAELNAGNKKSARIFLNAPNKQIEHLAPVEFIEKGNLKPLENMVKAMCARDKSPSELSVTSEKPTFRYLHSHADLRCLDMAA